LIRGAEALVIIAVIGAIVALVMSRRGSRRKDLKKAREARAAAEQRNRQYRKLLLQVYHLAQGAMDHEPVAVKIEQSINSHPLFIDELSDALFDTDYKEIEEP
jgi:type II secretory pathway pseudopilin PulG